MNRGDLMPENRNPMGLPDMVLFDVDGTLFGENDHPREEVVRLLVALSDLNVNVGVWSGSGAFNAERAVRRLAIAPYVQWTGSKFDVPPYHILFTVDDIYGADFGVPNLTV